MAIFQRGGADGLNMLIPYSEAQYYRLRPGLAIPAPGKDGGAIDLDGRFGLHPSLSSLKPLFDGKALAVVQATGPARATRSHMEGQALIESGLEATGGSGWLNRALSANEASGAPLRGVAFAGSMPLALRGPNAAVAVPALDSLDALGRREVAGLRGMSADSVDARLQGEARESLEALRVLEAAHKRGYRPAAGVNYPDGAFARSLQDIARLIKSGIGLEAACAESTGWDHHIGEAPRMDAMLRGFGDALAAFYRDLGDEAENVAIVTLSEFGRSARENGTGGTEHGHGSVMLVLGGAVRGGRIYGRWPGLEREQLYEGRDLAVTTDFRAVLSDLVGAQLGPSAIAQAFPGYQAAGEQRTSLLA